MVDKFLLETAEAISESTNRRDRFRIDKDVQLLLSDFDYPGNIRSLRNLIYELTSYVDGKLVLAKFWKWANLPHHLPTTRIFLDLTIKRE